MSGTATNPVWSPDGSVIVYTGSVVGVLGPLMMIHADGTSAVSLDIKVRVNTERYRFLPGRQQLVYIPTPNQIVSENFWLLDLSTMKSRQGVQGRFALFRSRLQRPDATLLANSRSEEIAVISSFEILHSR